MLHQNLSAASWSKKETAFQLASIGAEASRFLGHLKNKQPLRAENSLWRALELIDLTIADFRHGSHLRELTRLRESLCSQMYASDLQLSAEQLNRYFLPFGLISRYKK